MAETWPPTFKFQYFISHHKLVKCFMITVAVIYKIVSGRSATGSLIHLSLTSLLWDIGKQNSPRCDAAERGVPSGAIQFA